MTSMNFIGLQQDTKLFERFMMIDGNQVTDTELSEIIAESDKPNTPQTKQAREMMLGVAASYYLRTRSNIATSAGQTRTLSRDKEIEDALTQAVTNLQHDFGQKAAIKPFVISDDPVERLLQGNDILADTQKAVDEALATTDKNTAYEVQQSFGYVVSAHGGQTFNYINQTPDRGEKQQRIAKLHAYQDNGNRYTALLKRDFPLPEAPRNAPENVLAGKKETHFGLTPQERAARLGKAHNTMESYGTIAAEFAENKSMITQKQRDRLLQKGLKVGNETVAVDDKVIALAESLYGKNAYRKLSEMVGTSDRFATGASSRSLLGQYFKEYGTDLTGSSAPQQAQPAARNQLVPVA